MTREQFKSLFSNARTRRVSLEFTANGKRASIGAIYGAIYLDNSGRIIRGNAYRLNMMAVSRKFRKG